ncbi:MAG: DUF3866 domain-containing protein, partial [Acidimicrobiia bacterium]
MSTFRAGRVTAVLTERPGLQRVAVDGRPAYVLTDLTGRVEVDDPVIVNTTATELGLGSGGWDVVHWNLRVLEWRLPGPGHVMKLRYTSLQRDTGVAEEHFDYVPGDLRGVPVVALALHSQLAPVTVTVKHLRPDARVVYVMTDAGALPIALSDTVHELRTRGLLHATVTAGHAFGGDHEAVNTASAMEVARGPARADVVVVGTGPGVVGTGTRLGFSGLEVAWILDVAARLGAVPIVALRYSDADARQRHRGVSHHARTALELTHARVVVPVPAERVVPVGFGDHDVRPVAVP